MKDKHSSNYVKFIKFSFVGCSNTVICLAVYYFGLYIGLHYLIAYATGFLVSVCNAFFWNNKYVFKDKQENNSARAFIKLVASYGVTFILSIGIMSIFVEVIHIPSTIAPLLKLIITIPLNFILNKVWVFKDKRTPACSGNEDMINER